MATKAKTTRTRKKKLTMTERVANGKRAHVELMAKLRAEPNFEELWKEVNAELDLWIQIYQMREAAGLTQIDLAKKLGLSQSQVARLESSSHGGYTVDTLRKLAEATHHKMIITFQPDQHHYHA